MQNQDLNIPLLDYSLSKQKGNLQELPEELLQQISSFLSPDDFFSLKRTSSSLKENISVKQRFHFFKEAQGLTELYQKSIRKFFWLNFYSLINMFAITLVSLLIENEATRWSVFAFQCLLTISSLPRIKYLSINKVRLELVGGDQKSLVKESFDQNNFTNFTNFSNGCWIFFCNLLMRLLEIASLIVILSENFDPVKVGISVATLLIPICFCFSYIICAPEDETNENFSTKYAKFTLLRDQNLINQADKTKENKDHTLQIT